MGGSQSVDSGSPAAATQFVKEAIDNNCVVVFSKTSCMYCKIAKRVLDSTGVEYAAVELNRREDGDQIQNVLQAMTGQSTVS